MTSSAIASLQDLRAVERPGGVTLVPRPTPLTRLHYYDGKFLRASDLELEQRYQRQLVAFANQAGGTGVVHGYNAVWPGGDRLELGPGLAIDPQGRTLLTVEPATLSLTELIAASRSSGALALTASGPRTLRRAVFSDCEPLREDDGGTFADGGALYVVTLFHAEALCGTEDVLGRLCADACATSTERPFILEGVTVRAVPLRLETPLAISARVALTGRHLRSLVASAYFADEWRRGGSLISAAGLATDAWCLGAAAQGGMGVPIGLVARAGDSTLFFDAWTARRERIEPPNRRYWAGRMAMRPWDVFLAQVLQFQCQLAHCIDSQGEPEEDPCRPALELLRQTSEELARWLGASTPAPESTAGFESLERIRGRLADAAANLTAAPATRFLIGCGFTELPAAGYLPVVPSSRLTVNDQVRRMMGEGVDLRFCVVRPDFVAHALEEAQHMERISLLAGIDDPARKPQVDILVPDGEIDTRAVSAPGQGYEIELGLTAGMVELFERLVSGEGAGGGGQLVGTSGQSTGIALPANSLRLVGAGRSEDLGAGGLAFHLAGQARAAETGQSPEAVWLSVAVDRDPFALGLHERAGVSAEIVFSRVTTGGQGSLETRTLEIAFHGTLGVIDRGLAPAGGPRLTATADGQLVITGRAVGIAPVSRSMRLQEEVRFERTSGTGGGDTVTVSLPQFQFFGIAGTRLRVAVQVKRHWPAASQARVEGSISAQQSASQPFLNLDQRENADVVRADHPAHEAAIAALQRLGQALTEPSFADPRSRKLFPPPAAAAGELLVRATRDWVLFHRRRNKVCGIDTPRPQVSARSYRLYHVPLPDAGALEELRKILATGGGLGRFKPEAVGTVEFAGGLASVQTTHAIVRDTWDDKAPDGVEIVLGAIASQGAALADGQTLAGARLDTLAGVLAPVTARAAGALFEVLGDVPPDLPAVGLDGVVFYATLGLATTCQEVWVSRETAWPPDMVQEVIRIIEGPGLFQDLAKRLGAKPLGRAQFLGAELDAESVPALRDSWKQLQEEAPGLFERSLPAAIVVSAPSATAAEMVAHRTQGDELVNTLFGPSVQAAAAGVKNGGTEFPIECPSLTLVLLIRGGNQ